MSTRMTFTYFVLCLQMSLMHKFTDLYIKELDSLDRGEQPGETLHVYVMRCVETFTTLRGLMCDIETRVDQSEVIRKAILDAEQESKTHVLTQMAVTSEGMGRDMDQIMIMTQFWEDNYQTI